MAAEEELRLCIDRVVPDEVNPARATDERAAAEAALRSMRNRPPDIDISEVHHPATRMAVVPLKKWPNGSELKVRFLDGDATQRRKVEAKAHTWEQYANVTFRFVRTHNAEIRISFSADPGSWSAVGTDALVERYFPKHEPTMNYGWLRDETEDGSTSGSSFMSSGTRSAASMSTRAQRRRSTGISPRSTGCFRGRRTTGRRRTSTSTSSSATRRHRRTRPRLIGGRSCSTPSPAACLSTAREPRPTLTCHLATRSSSRRCTRGLVST